MAKQLSKKFIGNNEVDGTKILLEQGQSIKIKDSVGTEVELVKLGASDEVLVKGQEVAIKSELISETNARIAADSALDVRVSSAESTISTHTSQISSLQSDLSTETNARISADSALDVRVSAAESSISTHDSQISSLQSDLSTETNARISADSALDVRLSSAESSISTHDSQISSLQSDLSTETNNRISADSNLQSQIDAITGGGSGSLSAVQSELDNTQAAIGLEESGAYNPPIGTNYLGAELSIKSALVALDAATYGIESNLSVEVADRIAAVSDLQDQINNVLSNIDPAAIDSFTEVVAAFQAADSDLNGAITSLANSASADLDAEEAARIAADAALQGEIDAEEVARAAADVTLQNNINAEASARQAADDALDVRVDALEAVVWVKEKFAISNGQTSVTLSFTPKANSMSAFVDRLAIHEGAAEDFTISGTTMTFLNDLVSPGQSQLGSGDTVYVKYQK